MILLVSLILPVVLLLQKYNRHLSYDPSFSEIFIEYVRWIFGFFVISGVLFLKGRLKKK